MVRILVAALVGVMLLVCPARGDGPGAVPFSKGLDALAAGDWPAAITNFTAAIDANDDNAEFHLARGVANTLSEKFSEAQKDLNRALKLKDGDWETKLWLSSALFMDNKAEKASLIFSYGKQADYQYAEVVHTMAQVYMDSRYRGQYFDKETRKQVQTTEPVRTGFKPAAAAFADRHRTGGSAVQVTADTAVKALEEGKYAEALLEIERLRAKSPDDPNLLEMHAAASLGVGDALTAREKYTVLLMADPFNAKHYAGRAHAAAKLGDVRRAKADWEVGRKIDRSVAGKPGAELQAALKADSPEREQIPVLLEKLRAKSLTDVPWANLVNIATDLAVATANHRLRADETYQDRLRELLAEVKDNPRSADAQANLGEFLYKEATHIRGEAVEPRAANETYRPVTKETIAAEMKRAEEALDAAIARKGEHVRALTYKAGCLMWRLKWDEGERVVKKALGLRPTSPELLELLAQVLDHAAGVKAGRAQSLRTPEQWEDLNYIYTRRPSQAELDAADQYDAQAEELWKLAGQYLEQVVKSSGGTPLGFYYEGVLARRKRDPVGARAAFEQAVSRDPSMVPARDQLIAIYSALGLTKEAYEQQSEANNTVQTTAGPMLRWAWLETARTARQGAREACIKAWQLDPADPRCPAYLGVIEADASHFDEAAGYFKASLAMLEARARLHGQTFAEAGQGRINDQDLALWLGVQVRLADTLTAAHRTSKAAEVGAAILGLEARVEQNQLRRPLAAGMLPDPGGEPNKLPEADPPAVFFANAHVQLGADALARKDFRLADTHFRAARRYEALWPSTLPGRERLTVWDSWARVGVIKTLLGQGKGNEAWQEMNHDGWPFGLPDALKDEIAKLRIEVDAARHQR